MVHKPRRTSALLAAGWLLVPLAAAAQATDRFQPATPPELVASLDAARALRQSQRYDESAEALRRILAQAPDYYRAQYNLALAYAQQGEHDKALEAFSRAAEIKEKMGIVDASLENSIGWLHLLRGDLGAAERHLQRALVELAADAEADESTRRKVYNNLGTLYLYTGQLDLSRKYLETAKTQYGSALAARSLELLGELQAKERTRREDG
ncbi:MAG: tetratricopeptide repeat protein [Acidobacteriota bacterium]|nr:tetratricopeptide repeat protein [Acidobacteriota bacterium]MDH3522741.1 tetratricopeptide repeat protein [Acidobacteriota bacterium]